MFYPANWPGRMSVPTPNVVATMASAAIVPRNPVNLISITSIHMESNNSSGTAKMPGSFAPVIYPSTELPHIKILVIGEIIQAHHGPVPSTAINPAASATTNPTIISRITPGIRFITSVLRSSVIRAKNVEKLDTTRTTTAGPTFSLLAQAPSSRPNFATSVAIVPTLDCFWRSSIAACQILVTPNNPSIGSC